MMTISNLLQLDVLLYLDKVAVLVDSLYCQLVLHRDQPLPQSLHVPFELLYGLQSFDQLTKSSKNMQETLTNLFEAKPF